MKIERFEDLEIWQRSMDLTSVVYKATNNPRFAKDFGLKEQIRRAVVSVASNIAEGFEINNNNDFIRFLRIAKGSSGEVKTQLHIAKQLSYISANEFDEIFVKLEQLSAQIGKFISYLMAKKYNKEYKSR